MAIMEDLPFELVEFILEACDDFTSLDGLLQIFPHMELVFNARRESILRNVLSRCTLLSGRLHKLFYIVLAIESTTFTPSSLLGLLRGPMEIHFPQSSITSTGPTRKAIATAAKIHRTACACLQTFLDRINVAKPCRPKDSLEQTIKWINGEAPEPEGEVFEFKGTQSPSWVEQYRVHRVLWLQEIFINIYDAASTRWSWSEEDLVHFAAEYGTWTWLKLREQEIVTVIECLRDLSKKELPTSKPELGLPYLTVRLLPEDLKLEVCWPLPEIPGDSLDVPSWGQHVQSTEFQSPSIPYHRLLCSRITTPRNPLLKVDLRVFRRLGIPLWDRWRLYKSGLIDQPRAVRSPDGDLVGGPQEQLEGPTPYIVYTWYSLAKN
ncbi:hypothetical protein F1880_005642 [Penicillium rolfsii]|nr:hypothetical protein F1880_005642 [Penicillium rolfsii]